MASSLPMADPFIDNGSTEEEQVGLFGIRGSLDGEREQDFTEREQFIGLKIADEEFYLPIAAVNEILMLPPITYVPKCPRYVEGVINLRGRILPAVNLRRMMGIRRGKTTPSTRIIIVRYMTATIGVIVDAITYVVALLPKEIENQSLPGNSMGAELISRISKHEDQISGILDVSKIVHAAAEGRINFEQEEPAAAAEHEAA